MTDDDFSAPVHRALVRPLLLMGAEREPIMMLGLVAGVFIISIFKWWAAAFGVALWLVGSFFLRRLAEKDPIFSKVIMRSARFMRIKYLSHSATPFALPRSIGEK